MENIVKKLFEAGLLSEQDQVSLQESFDVRIQEAAAEARASAETQIREEMAQRFEHDKATLVEAMDRMLTDVVQKHETERASEVAKLQEARERFDALTVELKQAYKARLKEHAQVLEGFVMKKLSQELGEFNEDKQAVAATRVKYATALAECKTAYKARVSEHVSLMRRFVVEKLDGEMKALRSQQAQLAEQQKTLAEQAEAQRKQLDEQFRERVAKIDKFVVQKVSTELREFQEDKRALVEKKVQLVTEARQKLAATQRKFISEAARLVDQKVSETMKVELKQLHEDLERNRENMFGRRIFEAVVAEFKTSYFSEGTEVKKMEKIVEGLQSELEGMKSKLVESRVAVDVAGRKAKLAEDSATRAKVMNELLTPLSRDKRVVMQELLESVKTDKLRDAYTKYLPSVINDSGKKVTPQARQTLAEGAGKSQEKSCVAITGDQRNNRLQQTVQAEDTDDQSEMAKILILAGMKK
jgi:hypothetical protein